MREDFLVMLDWQPHVIRAGVGIGEVIPQPHVVSFDNNCLNTTFTRLKLTH
jgi:hypothetical protein